MIQEIYVLQCRLSLNCSSSELSDLVSFCLTNSGLEEAGLSSWRFLDWGLGKFQWKARSLGARGPQICVASVSVPIAITTTLPGLLIEIDRTPKAFLIGLVVVNRYRPRVCLMMGGGKIKS